MKGLKLSKFQCVGESKFPKVYVKVRQGGRTAVRSARTAWTGTQAAGSRPSTSPDASAASDTALAASAFACAGYRVQGFKVGVWGHWGYRVQSPCNTAQYSTVTVTVP